MSVSPIASTTGTPVITSVPLVERMRYHNWRAPPTTQDGGSVNVEMDTVNPDLCLPVTITTELTITLSHPSTIVIPHTLTYTPTCSATGGFSIPTGTGTNKTPTNDAPDSPTSELPASSLRDPFYASTIPMAYSIAMTITLSYVLLFLLFLSTPRPWLQKVATLTVVICLTLALAETTRILALEYSLLGEVWTADTESGSAKKIREKVVSGTEMRVGRIISDTFLWLAQVQTLIRLFPRHREKIVIKWAGFALIVLDTIFSILVHFLSPTTIMSPESFLDAIPALSYLFQIALSLLYASCVLYYSISSRIRRFAYYHPKAPSNLLIAILSLVSVLIPMVFFCLDIGQKDLAAWGDYVRWVGAAAASVVVWEWVDRIERLEREERREGVLGREIFDGDDGMVENMGVSQDDGDSGGCGHGHNKGPGSDAKSGGGESSRSTTASGALPERASLAGAVVNRHSRHSITSHQHGDEIETVTSDPAAPITHATRRNAVGEQGSSTPSSSITSQSPSISIEAGSDSVDKRGTVGFVGARTNDQHVTTQPQLERSTTGLQGSKPESLIMEGEVHHHTNNLDNTAKSESDTKDKASSSRDPEKQETPEVTDGKNGKEEGSWFSNTFRRRQHENADLKGINRPKWSSFRPNLPLSLPFVGSLTSASFGRDSTADDRTIDAAALGRRQLPVTVIPAPPRGRGISLRELEEARRSGVGDENVRGVGVWTGNSRRNGAYSSTVASDFQRRFSNSPGYGDSNEQSLQERLQQHQLQWNAQSYHDATIRQQQQLARTTSFSPLPTPSLPPLPPSPAVTATTSSWSANNFPYSQQQNPSYAMSPTSPTTPSAVPDISIPGNMSIPENYALSTPSSPRTSFAVMSGALPALSAEGSSGITPRQGISGGSGPSTSGARSRSTTVSAGPSSALGVVEEATRGSLESDSGPGMEGGKGRP